MAFLQRTCLAFISPDTPKPIPHGVRKKIPCDLVAQASWCDSMRMPSTCLSNGAKNRWILVAQARPPLAPRRTTDQLQLVSSYHLASDRLQLVSSGLIISAWERLVGELAAPLLRIPLP
jgi:hypothetical protein